MVRTSDEPRRKDKDGNPINGREFVDNWQRASEVQEIADYFNISYGTATRWAYEYRKLGYPLKYMRWAGDKRWTEYGKKGGLPSHKIKRVRRPREER